MDFPEHARAVAVSVPAERRYSICTLVTNPVEYAEMVESFVSAGFDPASCEYLYIDNSAGNQCDAYAGYNTFLNVAQGEYIILCHQDILLKYDRREHLDRAIHELNQIAPVWAVLGNAGGVAADVVAARITDSAGDENTGCFPVQVSSVDENFILVRRSANLCLSHDLGGFHLYGADLCQLARIIGRSAWVINFNLFHKSRGRRDRHFYQVKGDFIRKYQAALRGRVVQTSCTAMYLSGSKILSWFRNDGYRKMLFEQLYEARKKWRRTKDAVHCLEADALMAELGSGWFAVYWTLHKLTRPFQNLRRYVRRRIYKQAIGKSSFGSVLKPSIHRARSAGIQTANSLWNPARNNPNNRKKRS